MTTEKQTERSLIAGWERPLLSSAERLQLEELRRLRILIEDGVIAAQSIAQSLDTLAACGWDLADLVEEKIAPSLENIAKGVWA